MSRARPAAGGLLPAAGELLRVSPREALPLMERVLRGGKALAAEYPLIFRDEFPGDVIAVGEGREVRSACTILVRELVTPQGSVKVGLIGSVATDPSWQGRGLATRVLAEAESVLAAAGCELALLWADNPRFYYARGYRPIGCEHDFAVPRSAANALPAAAGVRALKSGDQAAVHALYAQHSSRAARSAQETAALLACPGMTTLVLERGRELAAYACLGRGADLGRVIHEWGGAPELVAALIRAHLKARPAGVESDLYVMTPATAEELAARLVAAGAQAKAGILGLGKVLCRAACAELVTRLLAPQGSAQLVDAEDEKRARFVAPRGSGWLDDDVLLALLFPAYGLSDEVAAFRDAYGLGTARIPVELYAFGLDSI